MALSVEHVTAVQGSSLGHNPPLWSKYRKFCELSTVRNQFSAESCDITFGCASLNTTEFPGERLKIRKLVTKQAFPLLIFMRTLKLLQSNPRSPKKHN